MNKQCTNLVPEPTDCGESSHWCHRRGHIPVSPVLITAQGRWGGSVYTATSFLTLLTYRTEPFLRSRPLRGYSRTSQHFIEPEGSLRCSQQPSTGPCPPPDRSSSIPSHHIPLRYILILSIHLRLRLPSGLFHFWFSHKYPSFLTLCNSK
jgi:hypothetical protein